MHIDFRSIDSDSAHAARNSLCPCPSHTPSPSPHRATSSQVMLLLSYYKARGNNIFVDQISSDCKRWRAYL